MEPITTTNFGGFDVTQPLFLEPVFHEKIWGGRKLETEFGYQIPAGNIGELWAISAHPNGPNVVANGPLAGKTLDKAWAEDQDYFGHQSGKVFPLLTKILDANASLSVQVHPDDAYAAAHERPGELGKTECWYVISADPDSYLIYGHHAKTRQQLADMIHSGDWEHLLRKVPVKAGDFVYVPSGTIHALNKGIVVLETQQSSDTTYRLYDYDRVGADGKKRELHLQQSIDVTTVPSVDPKLDITSEKVDDATITTYVTAPISPFFSVYGIALAGQLHQTASAPYTLVSVLDGAGTFSADGQDYPVKKGTHFLIPNQIKDWQFSGKMQIIESTPGETE
ncbi:mannose-6-phosphate isomerase [Lacticaseibacillus nasuensis JCM 17158]|uniref:Mannose-6-phosphate isomerase n=1 Tax=Lacticaseibacillus nasuensis JCM 17158 TaxID=1291734 RepID=A0A0R1JK56_9LACO|nr:mannose-6-phosphate isomerase, class I [Lacticaseibacillus nasuensis]KRK71741.1 mannose-6-phosphate isomerase [Lacticaseibacillus nasuensis JCM 17158]